MWWCWAHCHVHRPPGGVIDKELKKAALDYLEQAKMFWDNTVNKTFRVKEAIQPAQNSMLDGIRKEIKSFEVQLTKFSKEFKQYGPFTWIQEK